MAKIKIAKGVNVRDRHVRWNWEQSEANPEYVRYHVVVVDDKDRAGRMRKVFDQLRAVSSGIEIVRTVENRVERSDFRYLFQSFDSPVSPTNISWLKVGLPVKRDENLRERKVGRIEDYVFRIYKRH